MSDTLDDEAIDELLQILLDDVEDLALRRMLEHIARRGNLQRACIFKEWYETRR